MMLSKAIDFIGLYKFQYVKSYHLSRIRLKNLSASNTPR